MAPETAPRVLLPLALPLALPRATRPADLARAVVLVRAEAFLRRAVAVRFFVAWAKTSPDGVVSKVVTRARKGYMERRKSVADRLSLTSESTIVRVVNPLISPSR